MEVHFVHRSGHHLGSAVTLGGNGAADVDPCDHSATKRSSESVAVRRQHDLAHDRDRLVWSFPFHKLEYSRQTARSLRRCSMSGATACPSSYFASLALSCAAHTS